MRFFNDSKLGGTLTTCKDGVIEAFSDQKYNSDAESPERIFAKAGKSIIADIQAHLPTPVDQLIRADLRGLYQRGGK